jgi:streptomycin 6-kinase
MARVRPLPMPTNLVGAAAREGRLAWLATLQDVIPEIAVRWGLTLGEPFQPGGQTAWVAPVRDAYGTDLVLKVAWPHPEAVHEAHGLRVWNGNGAVRLHASLELDGTNALLLERCVPGVALTGRPEPEQDVVVAGLLHRLWTAPIHGFRPLQEMCEQWADQFDRTSVGGTPGLDPGLTRAGMELFRSLPATADRHVLLFTDLHAGNVLSAERELWLAIDPKPYAGDPTYDALQHMLNCDGRLSTDPDALLRRMADLLDLDHGRLRLWLFARCVQESVEWPRLAAVARRVAP